MIRQYGTRLKVEQGLMIAPLLDIMFLVLLFFILNASSGSIDSFDVDIPQVQQAGNPHPSHAIVVSIMYDEMEYLVNDQWVSLENFEAFLRERMQVTQNYQILLLGSERASYGRVMMTMDAIKAAGARGVSLGVERIESSE